MKLFFWLIVLATIGGIVYFFARWRRQWAERQQEADARMMSLIVQARPPAPAGAARMAPAPAAPQERLLLDAAAKAGEAGEAVLSIQLYAKLLSRYPQTSFAAQARSAVEAQKKRLAKA